MKKCIILDLDNTLWGGIVGEDGMKGIKLSLSDDGSSFIAFQQALKDLYDRGVILAINSRNNLEDAMEVIRTHPNMILKENHFAAQRINWNDKATNIKELAQELNIGTDSMVFLDDDPTNRALVREMLPEVETPELPLSPSEYVKFLINLPYFASAAITDEDKMRGNLYVTERLRKEAEKSFSSGEDFLKNLNLELSVFIDDATSIARLAQLTEKTNQFNTFKQPLTEGEVKDKIEDSIYTVAYGRVIDRFGDYGITNVAIIKHELEGDMKTWSIEQYLMSCRVIGRGIEEAFLGALAKLAAENGAENISIKFKKTEKNKPAEEFVNKYFSHKIVPLSKVIYTPSWVKINQQ